MNNQLYTIDNIYNVIRKYYLSQFPHQIKFQALDAINHHVKEHNKEAFVLKDESGYTFKNPMPNQKSSDPFTNSLGINSRNLEEYLSNDEGLKCFFQDVNAFHLWLVEYGFIKNGVATEKMLTTKTLK